MITDKHGLFLERAQLIHIVRVRDLVVAEKRMRQVALRTHVDEQDRLVRVLDGELLRQVIRERRLARPATIVPYCVAAFKWHRRRRCCCYC